MSVVNTIFNHMKTRLVACCALQGVPKKQNMVPLFLGHPVVPNSHVSERSRERVEHECDLSAEVTGTSNSFLSRDLLCAAGFRGILYMNPDQVTIRIDLIPFLFTP